MARTTKDVYEIDNHLVIIAQVSPGKYKMISINSYEPNRYWDTEVEIKDKGDISRNEWELLAQYNSDEFKYVGTIQEVFYDSCNHSCKN